jgi:hypothetical protein
MVEASEVTILNTSDNSFRQPINRLSIATRNVQDDLAASIVGAKPLSDIDRTRRDKFLIRSASHFFDSEAEEFVYVVNPADFKMIDQRRPEINHSTVVSSIDQSDRGERANDPILRPSETFKKNSVDRCQLPRLLLTHDSPLTLAAKLRDRVRNRRSRNAQPGIAAGGTPVKHQATNLSRQLSRDSGLAGLEFDRGAAVFSSARNPRILQELVACYDPAACRVGQFAHQMSGKLVCAGIVERVRVVNADKNHVPISTRVTSR